MPNAAITAAKMNTIAIRKKAPALPSNSRTLRTAQGSGDTARTQKIKPIN